MSTFNRHLHYGDDAEYDAAVEKRIDPDWTGHDTDPFGWRADRAQARWERDRGNADALALPFSVAVIAPLGAIRWLGPVTAGLLIVGLAVAWLAIGCCVAGAGLRDRLDAEAPKAARR